MSGTFRFLFLFSSFGPLYFIFSVKLCYNNGVPRWVSVLAFLLFVASLLVFFFLKKSLYSDNGTWFNITDLKPKDSEIFSYLTTYIPPLITRDMSSPEVFVPLTVLYSIIAVAYMRLDAPYLNPYFILFGYRVYEAKIAETKRVLTIISQHNALGNGGRTTLYEIGNGDLYLAKAGPLA